MATFDISTTATFLMGDYQYIMELKSFYGKTKMKQLHHQIQSMIIIISYSRKKKKNKIKDKYQNQTTNNQLESETLT